MEYYKKIGYTLSETLIVMAIIGSIAMLTVPVVVLHDIKKEIISGVQDFNTEITDSVYKWKEKNLCTMLPLYMCFKLQSALRNNNNCETFADIAKPLHIIERAAAGDKSEFGWLPKQTLDYYGNKEANDGISGVSQTSSGLCRFVFLDGKTVSVDADSIGFSLLVDVNGQKPPNRIGKDTFPMSIGYKAKSEINLYPKNSKNGLCGIDHVFPETCNAENLDPDLFGGASPTPYVVLTGNLPNFDKLSRTVRNMKP